MNKYVLVLFLLMVSCGVYAADCTFVDATITEVEHWDNGEIFVYFSNTDSQCECTIKSRLAIPAGSTNDFLKSQVLTALTSKSRVRAVGRTREDGYCTIHGNTAELIRFRVYAN